MAGYDNVKDYGFEHNTPEKQREIAKMGGKASGEAKRARKTLKEELLILLDETDGNGLTVRQRASMALLIKAVGGNTKAFELLRDTIGEKPVDEIKTTVEGFVSPENERLLHNVAARLDGREKNKNTESPEICNKNE